MKDDEKAPRANEHEGSEEQGLSAEASCRRLLGNERFEDLKAQVDPLPESIDREIIYRAITKGVQVRDGYAVLDPKWCKDRDDALEQIGQAIVRLKAVLRNSPWARAVDSEELVETWAGGLEREYQRLVEPEGDGLPFMKLSRVRLGWVSRAGGRPRTAPRETRAVLRALGVPRVTERAILAASGLAGPSPKAVARKPRQ